VEVHPPHSPIRSIKDFLLHLLAITIGLLIALSLEASAEWMHNRRLVHEARENIAQEIRDNKRSLAKEMTALPTEEQQLEKLLTVVNAEERGGAAKPDQHLVWTVTRLSDSSWSTAFSTGAVGHMNYDEVRRYSQLYALQQMFNSSMDRYLESRRDMYSFLTRVNLPDKPSPTEFEDGKRAISSEMVTGQFLREIGEALNGGYAKVQGGKE
jgi:ribosome-associated protein YbcJ (S4-like RNA binding protein)